MNKRKKKNIKKVEKKGGIYIYDSNERNKREHFVTFILPTGSQSWGVRTLAKYRHRKYFKPFMQEECAFPYCVVAKHSYSNASEQLLNPIKVHK